ncbi:MAG: type II restriction endonuclease NgoMIV [Gemmatales bacterium]|nr:MAG: type II restriction endonuclease NgoMIV [Gemmatales bacterium]
MRKNRKFEYVDSHKSCFGTDFGMTRLASLREEYHKKIGEQIVRRTGKSRETFPNFADGSSRSSIEIAKSISERLGFSPKEEPIVGQTAGNLFEKLTAEFIENCFQALQHLRPGSWQFLTAQTSISNFVQYRHLDTLVSLVKADPTLASVLGHGYIITPDIVVCRKPISDAEINRDTEFVRGTQDECARLTPLRQVNHPGGASICFLHASISCKWTIRSDRSQNTRTEALNLIRNRKGHCPHIVAVTAEPLPMRIASLALGTGDLDCVYHFALPELKTACKEIQHGEDQLEMLETMIKGNRLRDISDLPFDLVT